MSKRSFLYEFCLVFLFISLFSTHCGSVNEVGSGGSSSGNINIVIKNPDPNSSGTAKAVFSSDVFQSKTLTAPNVTSCTLTVSASDISTITQAFSVASGASTATTSLTVPSGSGRTFAVDCSDSSGTTNNITVGYKGSTSADVAFGNNSISLTPQFKNLISDDSSGVHFMRLNQENSTQTKLTIGFGSVLTDGQKINLRCVIEFDATGNRTSLGVIDGNQSSGLTTSTKSGSYVLITGGTGRPDAYLYNSSDAKVMKLNPSWTTTDAGNTMVSATFGITQLKTSLDSNEKGQYAGACSLTGSNPYDLLPNSGYAVYELDANTNVSDVASLIDNGSSCSTSRSGETCSSGDCPANGLCRSLTTVSLAANVTNLAGPDPGTTTGDNVDGVGNIARFNDPEGVCISPDGATLFVGDSNAGGTIRQTTISTGQVTTVAGSASATGTTDATGTTARFNNPAGCVVDPTNTNLYIADRLNHSIRKMVIATTVVTTFAGTAGSSGNTNGTGTAASFFRPTDVAIDPNGANLYVSDQGNNLIRKIIISSQAVTTLAGSGTSTYADGTGTSASFRQPIGLVIDSTGTNLYVTDAGQSNRIRKIVISTQVVSTLAGSGTSATTDGTGTLASFKAPWGITIDPTDTNLYVTEFSGHTVRKIGIITGVVTTLAGSGASGDSNATGTSASFGTPQSIVASPAGTTLYVSESTNNKIRQIQ